MSFFILAYYNVQVMYLNEISMNGIEGTRRIFVFEKLVGWNLEHFFFVTKTMLPVMVRFPG